MGTGLPPDTIVISEAKQDNSCLGLGWKTIKEVQGHHAGPGNGNPPLNCYRTAMSAAT